MEEGRQCGHNDWLFAGYTVLHNHQVHCCHCPISWNINWFSMGQLWSLNTCLFLSCVRYLLVQVEDVRGPEEGSQPDVSDASADQKTSLTSIGGREIKDKLTGLFSPNKLKPRPAADTQPPAAPVEKKKERGKSSCLDWAAGYMPRGKAEISEACRQAFTATCHLLLECTTFPVYLSEEETLALHTDMFGHTGQVADRLWFFFLQQT